MSKARTSDTIQTARSRYTWGFSVIKRLSVRVKPSCLAVWLCFFVFDPSVYTLLVLAAILLHEMGHLFWLFLFSVPRVQVIFSAFGAEMNYDGCFLSHKQQMFLSLGGVTVNLLTALACLPFQNVHTEFLAVCSLCLAVLNLLPIKGLDGGRALEAFLLCKMELSKALLCLRRLSLFFLFLLFGLSFVLLAASGFNFSLLLFTLYLSLSILR